MSKFCNHCKEIKEDTHWYKLNTSTNCKQYSVDYRRANAEKNRTKVREKSRQWRLDNPGYAKHASAKFYKQHKEEVINRNYEYTKKRRLTDKAYDMSIILRQRLGKALTKGYKTGSAVADLGCSMEEFVTHLESKFVDGMNWDNHGRHGWHVDHIKPLAAFDLSNPEETKKACHYTNLQPLWAVDNIKKSNKFVA